MAVKASGRFVPPSAFAAGTGETFTGAYAWNAPREAVGRERPLTRDEMRQVQGVLSTINRLPYFLRSLFTSRYDYIRRNKSPVRGRSRESGRHLRAASRRASYSYHQNDGLAHCAESAGR